MLARSIYLCLYRVRTLELSFGVPSCRIEVLAFHGFGVRSELKCLISCLVASVYGGLVEHAYLSGQAAI